MFCTSLSALSNDIDVGYFGLFKISLMRNVFIVPTSKVIFSAIHYSRGIWWSFGLISWQILDNLSKAYALFQRTLTLFSAPGYRSILVSVHTRKKLISYAPFCANWDNEWSRRSHRDYHCNYGLYFLSAIYARLPSRDKFWSM